jgi:hypothetical protein
MDFTLVARPVAAGSTDRWSFFSFFFRLFYPSRPETQGEEITALGSVISTDITTSQLGKYVSSPKLKITLPCD